MTPTQHHDTMRNTVCCLCIGDRALSPQRTVCQLGAQHRLTPPFTHPCFMTIEHYPSSTVCLVSMIKYPWVNSVYDFSVKATSCIKTEKEKERESVGSHWKAEKWKGLCLCPLFVKKKKQHWEEALFSWNCWKDESSLTIHSCSFVYHHPHMHTSTHTYRHTHKARLRKDLWHLLSLMF